MRTFTLKVTCFLLCCYLVDCHSPMTPSCNVAQPLQELPWLKAIVADSVNIQDLKIYQATYKQGLFYEVDITPGADGDSYTLYDCRGNVFCRAYDSYGGWQSNCPDVFKERVLGPLLYKR